MREIKFRAWDKRIKKMLYTDIANKFIGSEMEFYPIVFGVHDLTYSHHLELMQYTGLTDKNGKEIYEGDILEQEDGRRTRVVWHDYCAMFDLVGIIGKGVPHPIYDRPERLQTIIGNVYENPELRKT